MRMINLIKRLDPQEAVPFGWGIYRFSPIFHEVLIAPLPFNWVFRWFYDFKIFLVHGVKRKNLEQRCYDAGYKDGFKDCERRNEPTLDMRLTEIERELSCLEARGQ